MEARRIGEEDENESHRVERAAHTPSLAHCARATAVGRFLWRSETCEGRLTAESTSCCCYCSAMPKARQGKTAALGRRRLRAAHFSLSVAHSLRESLAPALPARGSTPSPAPSPLLRACRPAPCFPALVLSPLPCDVSRPVQGATAAAARTVPVLLQYQRHSLSLALAFSGPGLQPSSRLACLALLLLSHSLSFCWPPR